MEKKKQVVISIKLKDKKYDIYEKRKKFDGKYGTYAGGSERESSL